MKHDIYHSLLYHVNRLNLHVSTSFIYNISPQFNIWGSSGCMVVTSLSLLFSFIYMPSVYIFSRSWRENCFGYHMAWPCHERTQFADMWDRRMPLHAIYDILTISHDSAPTFLWNIFLIKTRFIQQSKRLECKQGLPWRSYSTLKIPCIQEWWIMMWYRCIRYAETVILLHID